MRGLALATAVCASVTAIAGAGVLATPSPRESVSPASSVSETGAASPNDPITVPGCVMFCAEEELGSDDARRAVVPPSGECRLFCELEQIGGGR